MAKPKKLIEQPINLTPDVQVIVRAPRDKWPVINWNGGVVTIAVQGAEVLTAPTIRSAAQPAASQSNGPQTDTPEIVAMKEALTKKHPKPFTSADAFREQGFDFDPEGLQALGDQVV